SIPPSGAQPERGAVLPCVETDTGQLTSNAQTGGEITAPCKSADECTQHLAFVIPGLSLKLASALLQKIIKSRDGLAWLLLRLTDLR
ncbi:MAG TPA: hypothetical protein VGF67_32755, partial [Ktedonobacteraceae bacterium]